jgi:ectoine hydroxylase-related dioxygenase (phytanoyl-CoA dioxygenase family)
MGVEMSQVEQATIARVPAGTDADEVADLLARDGAVIVERLLPQEVVDAVNAELEVYLREAGEMKMYVPLLDGFHGSATRHVSGLAGKSRTFAVEVMAHPLYQALADRFLRSPRSELHRQLLPDGSNWILNLGHMINRGPGAGDQLLHRDEEIWEMIPYPRRGELMIASVIAFVDFRKENGATRVVPGSHLWDDRNTHILERRSQPDESQTVYAEMPAGSAVIYLGSTYHGASANRTEEEWRRGAHMSFCRGYLRTEENNYLAVPPDRARELPRRCQEIIGYSTNGFLGALDLLDPVDLLADGRL